MLRLSAPAWLHASRQGDPPVALDEHEQFTPASLERVELGRAGVPVPPCLVFSRRLARQVQEEGALPRGFGAIVRGLLDELKLAPPLRLTCEPRDLPPIVVDGVGCSVEALPELERRIGDARDASALLRGLAADFALHVGGLAPLEIEPLVAAVRAKYRVHEGTLPVEAARAEATLAARLVEARCGESIPLDPADQVECFVAALLARHPDSVIVLAPTPRPPARVLRGVAYSRHPGSGDAELFVDARLRVGRRERKFTVADVARRDPLLFAELQQAARQLERERGDAVSFEFEQEDGTLTIERATSADRTRRAALRIAADLAAEGIVDEATARSRVEGIDRADVRARGVLADGVLLPLIEGESASPGATTGLLALSGPRALLYRRGGHQVVLLGDERGADLGVLDLALGQGLVLLHGGIASRLARAARRLDLPCVVASRGGIDARGGLVRFRDVEVAEGSTVTLDGDAGALYAGEMPIVEQAWTFDPPARQRVPAR